MAKKITVKTSYYEINADVVVSDSEGAISIEQFEGVNLTSSKRENAKVIRDKFTSDGYEVIAIRNLTTTLMHNVEVYTVKGSNAEIVAACEAYGLEVVKADSESEDQPEGENA